MSGKLWLAGGFAAGYILGSKAGRERYEQLAATARKVKEEPAVASALETVQTHATRLYENGRAAVQDKLNSARADRPADTTLADHEFDLADTRV